MESEKIIEGIYMVGGADISSPEDASVFIIDCGDELCMIDCGAGKSARFIVENIEEAGFDPSRISGLLLTHCHVDHIGALSFFREKYKLRVYSHELDSDAIESGDPKKTASTWYGVRLPRTRVDLRLKGAAGTIDIGNRKIKWLHTPGHTPGSVVFYIDVQGQRILFGQDIHGPFHTDFDSDISMWRESMEKVITLDSDILCEGHFGIIKPKEKVKSYIQGYLDTYAG
jgi:glyoxylase-like metal-dependent hydrolase (beta-lactamase superfamily II)